MTEQDELDFHMMGNRHWMRPSTSEERNPRILLPHPHLLWVRLGSSISETIDMDLKYQVLLWLYRTLQCDWKYCEYEHLVMGTSASGRRVPMDHVSELWISIEDPGAAMLSKLTWIGLRSPEHAEH